MGERAGVRGIPITGQGATEHGQTESFFKTRKREAVSLNEDWSCAGAEANLDRFIEQVSNTKLLRSRVGYRPPAECEAAW